MTDDITCNDVAQIIVTNATHEAVRRPFMLPAELVGAEFTMTHRKPPSLPPHHSAPHLATSLFVERAATFFGWRSNEDESLTPPTPTGAKDPTISTRLDAK